VQIRKEIKQTKTKEQLGQPQKKKNKKKSSFPPYPLSFLILFPRPPHPNLFTHSHIILSHTHSVSYSLDFFSKFSKINKSRGFNKKK